MDSIDSNEWKASTGALRGINIDSPVIVDFTARADSIKSFSTTLQSTHIICHLLYIDTER